MSFTLPAIHCCKSNQRHTEQIGCDVKMTLFPPAGFTHPHCDSYIHLCVSVSTTWVNARSDQFPLPPCPLKRSPIPNLDWVFFFSFFFFSPPTHWGPLCASTTLTVHVRPLACLWWLRGGNASPADYERVKLAECISITPITVTFTPTSQLSR